MTILCLLAIMCSVTLTEICVSIVEGLAGGVLSYRLNDINKRNTLTHLGRDNDDSTDNSLLITSPSSAEINREALEDFGEDDNIYEQFIKTPENGKEYIVGADLEWKQHRSPACKWLLHCFLYSFYIVVLGGFIMGGVAIAIMFIDINSADVCYNISWDKIPVLVQRVRVAVQVIEGWFIQCFHVITMILVFGFKLVDQLHILYVNIAAAFIDSVYRLFLQMFNVYDASWRTFPLNFLSVGLITFNSYSIGRHFFGNLKQNLILTFQLGVQFILGLVTLYFTCYVMIPWFVTLNQMQQAIVAGASPIFGAIIKAISRISVQCISRINHPGTSYILSIGAYLGAALVYRTIQAELESFTFFTLLCVGHGLVGLLERLSVVLRDHFYVWVYKKILKREANFSSFIGSFRTPRTQRFVADITICNILHETTALIFTNAFVQLYALQVGVTATGEPSKQSKLIAEFFLRTLVAFASEYFFTVFGIFVLTWYLNVPIIRVWKKKWRSLILNNLFMCFIVVMYSTAYLTDIVSAQYKKHLPINRACNVTDLLFFN